MTPQFQNYDPRHPTAATRWPFRKGRTRQPGASRIARVAGRPLSSFNVLYCYATLPFRHPSAWSVARFLWTVATKFFMPQYLQKIHVLRRPVKHVDHELDSAVPFVPEHVGRYMDFINIWIRPMAMLEHRFGTLNGSRLCAEFLRYLTLTYREAYKMYRQSFTTTRRPTSSRRSIQNLQRADPHFMCVPSLHISIVCLCFSFYRMLFERESFTRQETEQWLPELYDRAVEIAETVLYVKQHSVNCIPAALYMMTRITPELFTPEDAVAFINRLFQDAPDVTPEHRRQITAHIQYTYERFLLEGFTEPDWTAPVMHWLADYVPAGA